MQRPSIVGVLIPIVCVSLAGCMTPSEPVEPRAEVRGAPTRLMAGASQAPNGISTMTFGYIVMPGTETLLLELPVTSPVNELKFLFGGSGQALRIREIIGIECGRSPRVSFTDATPAEATQFFALNSLENVQSRSFDLLVENLSARPQRLTVQAKYAETGATAPCA